MFLFIFLLGISQASASPFEGKHIEATLQPNYIPVAVTCSSYDGDCKLIPSLSISIPFLGSFSLSLVDDPVAVERRVTQYVDRYFETVKYVDRWKYIVETKYVYPTLRIHTKDKVQVYLLDPDLIKENKIGWNVEHGSVQASPTQIDVWIDEDFWPQKLAEQKEGYETKLEVQKKDFEAQKEEFLARIELVTDENEGLRQVVRDFVAPMTPKERRALAAAVLLASSKLEPDIQWNRELIAQTRKELSAKLATIQTEAYKNCPLIELDPETLKTELKEGYRIEHYRVYLANPYYNWAGTPGHFIENGRWVYKVVDSYTSISASVVQGCVAKEKSLQSQAEITKGTAAIFEKDLKGLYKKTHQLGLAYEYLTNPDDNYLLTTR